MRARLTLPLATRTRATTSARDLARRHRGDPIAFNTEVLGRSPYWSRQRDLCALVHDHAEVAVVSGNAVGKSYWLAGVVLWWACTRPGALVVTTAPSQSLLGTVLWKEIRRAASRSRIPVEVRSDSPRTSPQEAVVPALGSSILGIATRGVERLSGQHAADLLVAVDEASGIDEEIAEALDSLKPSKSVWIGNPLRRDGRFWNLAQQAQRERDQGVRDGVQCATIATLDGPHARLDHSPWGLADRAWLDRMRRRHGETSRWWQSHVLAQFPDVEFSSTIPSAWVRAAIGATRQGPPGEPCLAIDLAAGSGRDRTVLLVRDRLGLLALDASPLLPPAQAAAHAAQLCRLHGVPTSRVVYDAGGLLGRDFPAYLERHGITDAHPYYGSGRGGKRFANLRTRCAWTLRRRLCPDSTSSSPGSPPPLAIPGGLPWLHDLVDEIEALRHDEDERQVLHLETKDALSRRLGRSPDLIDALLMSYALDPEDAHA